MVCEMLCESRKRQGLPGLAIAWGPVGGVGYVEEVLEVHAVCCVMLPRLLARDVVETCQLPVNPVQIAEQTTSLTD